MRKLPVLTLLLIFSTSAFAGDKQKGTTTLKDVQPAGTTEKNHKHQQYDLSFVTTTGKDYTCRTKEGNKVKATDIPVGTNITYEIDDNNGKVKTSSGKKFDCMIVRVADASTTSNSK
jgi:hypothetical protein